MFNLFNASMALKGYPLAQALEEYFRVKSLEGDNLNLHLLKMRQVCLAHHLNTTPALGELYSSNKVDDRAWEDIPVMQKRFFQKERTLSRDYEGVKCFSNSTSGSSGVPTRFVKDKLSHAMTWAHIIDSYREYGLEYGKTLQARFFGMPLNSSNAVRREKVKDFLSARRRFSAHDMSSPTRQRILDCFSRKKFGYVYGYANTLALFSRYLLDEGVNISDVCPSVRNVIYTSEVCTPEDRTVIEKAFGVPLYSEYGAAELGVLAFEDKFGRHVANDRQFYFEVVDNDDRLLPDGEVGRLLVTSLYNMAMPFIRYEVGDRAALSRDNGVLHLEKLEGRVGDFIRLSNGDKIPGLTLYTSTKMIAAKYPQIKEFYVKQVKLGLLKFELVMSDDLTPNLKRDFRGITRAYLPDSMEVEIQRVDQIQRTSAGKMRHFESLL